MIRTVTGFLASIGAALLVSWAGVTPADSEAKPAPILIELSSMQTSTIFGCRIPVTVRYSGSPALTWANAQARAYRGREVIASSDIDTARDPLLGNETTGKVKYDTEPVRFDLTPELCDAMTKVHIVRASCSFDNGPAQDCLDRLRLSVPPGSTLEFAIGEPPGQRTVLSRKPGGNGLGG